LARERELLKIKDQSSPEGERVRKGGGWLREVRTEREVAWGEDCRGVQVSNGETETQIESDTAQKKEEFVKKARGPKMFAEGGRAGFVGQAELRGKRIETLV